MRNWVAILIALGLLAAGALVVWVEVVDEPGSAACIAIGGDCAGGSNPIATPPSSAPPPAPIVRPIGDCTPR